MSVPPPPKDTPPGREPAAISGADFPALRSFLRGYFHQDMQDEYGSPVEAVQEFCADASPEERAAVAKDWARFVEQTQGRRLEEINRILTGPLGSSCLLTVEDMQQISAVLSRTSRKSGPH